MLSISPRIPNCIPKIIKSACPRFNVERFPRLFRQKCKVDLAHRWINAIHWHIALERVQSHVNFQECPCQTTGFRVLIADGGVARRATTQHVHYRISISQCVWNCLAPGSPERFHGIRAAYLEPFVSVTFDLFDGSCFERVSCTGLAREETRQAFQGRWQYDLIMFPVVCGLGGALGRRKRFLCAAISGRVVLWCVSHVHLLVAVLARYETDRFYVGLASHEPSQPTKTASHNMDVIVNPSGARRPNPGP